VIFFDNHFNFLLYVSGVSTIPTLTILHKPRYQHHQKDWKSGISLQLKLHRDHYIHSKDLFQQVVKHIYHSAWVQSLSFQVSRSRSIFVSCLWMNNLWTCLYDLNINLFSREIKIFLNATHLLFLFTLLIFKNTMRVTLCHLLAHLAKGGIQWHTWNPVEILHKKK
jgi:predicted SprT family Zn-dependent metalloprotease